MASDDDYDDGFDGGFDDNQGFEDVAPAKSGMSTPVKILIALLVGGGLLGVICCGGMFWYGSEISKRSKFVENPDEARELSEQIVHMDVPERFTPQVGALIDAIIFKVTMVAYADESGESAIMLIETPQSGEGDAEQQLDQIQRQLEQQGQGGQFQKADLEETETETRELTVRGQPVQFEFTKGKDAETDVEIQQIMGFFPSDDGTAILLIQMPVESYDEAEITKMIESIE